MYRTICRIIAAIAALATLVSGIEAAHARLRPGRHTAAISTVTTATYSYGSTSRMNLIAQYVKGATGRPWVLSIHGGGWVSQDATTMAAADDLFNAQGYDTFAINYELLTTPGVTEYTQRYDVKTALAWVRAHASTFGINADRGAVYGYSAGGHLALLVGEADPLVQAVLTTSAIAQPKRVADDQQGMRPDTEPDDAALDGLYPNEVTATGGCDWYSPNAANISALCTQRWSDFTPNDQVVDTSPPAMLYAGTADDFYTVQQGDAFCYWMRYGAHPRPCTSIHKDGYPHGQQTFLDDPSQGLAFLAANV